MNDYYSVYVDWRKRASFKRRYVHDTVDEMVPYCRI